MLERIIIAGAGGQGIILLGKLIARVAAGRVPHVTFFPAYGAEVRGGASHCEVILSAREIASPCAERADILILMNQHGATEVLNRLAPSGLALINSSLCHVAARPGQTLIAIPASALADKAGNPRAANLVMLGAFLRHKPLFKTTDLEQAIRKNFAGAGQAELLAVNLRALHAGLDYAERG